MQEATIKILTPQTSNGMLNIIGEDGQMVFRESIVPAVQRAYFEKINTKLPDNLKHRIIENKTNDVVTDTATAGSNALNDKKPKL